MATVDHVVRARLLAARSPGSGDWLEALPLSSVGNKMDNATVRIAAGLRLGAPIVCPHVCVCGKTVAVDGHHGLSCRFGSGRHSRHNQINDVLRRAFIKSGSLATREPHSMCTDIGKRLDGETQIPGHVVTAWHGMRLVQTISPYRTFRPAVHVLDQRQQQQKCKITEVHRHYHRRRFCTCSD